MIMLESSGRGDLRKNYNILSGPRILFSCEQYIIPMELINKINSIRETFP